jgi:hypothetical protein
LFVLVHFLTKTADARKLSDKIQKKGGKALVGVKENLVDIVWGKDRPPRPNETVKVLGLEFAGKKFEDKLEDLRKELEKKKSPGFVVCTLYDSAQGVQPFMLTNLGSLRHAGRDRVALQPTWKRVRIRFLAWN